MKKLGFLQRVRTAWGSLRADSGMGVQLPPWDDAWYASRGYQTATGLRVSPESAMRVAAVFACVRVVSETVASLPLIIYRRKTDGGKERAVDHPLYSILHDSPNQWQTAYEFLEMMQAHLELRGNAYALIVAGNGSAIDSLVPLHPDRVIVKRLPNGRLQYSVRDFYGGDIKTYLQEEMLHLRGLSADGLVGMSTISVGAEAVANALASQEYSSRFFENDATPPVAFVHQKTLSADAYGRLKVGLAEAHGGANHHKPIILEEGMDVKTLGINPIDSQLLEARQASRGDIASMFRVPPHKMGDLTRATFCLPAGTDVLTVGGPKPIERIAVGELVWSRDDSGKWAQSKVLRSACSGVDPILRIRTTNRTIRANTKHRILARRKYPDPHPGKGGYQCSIWKDEYIPAGELKQGDTILAMDGGFSGETAHTPTRRNASVGFMAFCGLLLGDGNVNANHGVTIARDARAPYMDYYRDVMRAEFARYENHGRMSNAVLAMAPITITEGDRQTRFASVLAAHELTDLGFSGTARTKSVPAWIYSMMEAQRLAFIRGFVDADGHVDKKGRISVSSCNRELLTGIRHLCMMSAIPVTNLRCQKGSTTLPNGKAIKFEQWTFTCSDPGANRKIGSASAIDAARLEAGQPFNRKARNYPRFGGQGSILIGATLSRIAAITMESAEPVYDIEVEGTHNFVADGVLVHNSNIEQQNIEFATDCIRPRLVRLEKRIQKDLVIALNFGDGEEYFCEFLMEALMRGDQQSRYRSYAIGRQWGWLSANDVCRFESLNPIGPGGDEYMRPLNMENATQADPDQSDESVSQGDSTGDGGGAGAHRLQEFVRAAAERVVRKEVKALRKAEGRESSGDFAREVREFYSSHGDYVGDSMHIAAEHAARYVDANRALVLANVNAISLIEERSVRQLVEMAMPAFQQASKQRGKGVTVNVEPHIHMAQPEISIQTSGKSVDPAKTIRTGTVKRRTDGNFDVVIKEQPVPETTKSGVVEKRPDGKFDFVMKGE